MVDATFFNPDKLYYRIILLVGICFLTFGSYFIYDIPGALPEPIDQRLGISDTKRGALYSVYSWPNTVLALFGGLLIDRVFGIRFAAIVFCTLVLIGQIVFAIGISSGNFWICIVGRFIFGLGGESLSVSQSTYTARWFTGKELALAFGITLSFSRVGSAVNFNTMPRIVESVGLTAAIWISVIICGVSMFFALTLALLDKKAENYKRSQGVIPPVNNERISLKDVIYFPLSMWLLVFICVTFYVAVFIFVQFGSQYIQQKYNYSANNADSVMSIISLFSAGASPFLGFGVDKIGRNLFWVVTASSVLCGAHLFLNFTHVTPVAALFIMGAAYSTCAAALWPGVALIIPSLRLGTAYGLMTALQNLGLAVAPLVVGYVIETTNNYEIAEFIYAGSAATAAILAAILICVDMANGVRLNASPSRLKEIREAEALSASQEQSKSETDPLLVNQA